MNFTIPTTKPKMYEVLNDIFHYYRIQREAYTAMNIPQIAMTRMTYTPKTEAELIAEATAMLKASQEKRVLDLKRELTEKIATNTAKITEKSASYESRKAEINDKYADLKDEVRAESAKRGIGQSSIVSDRISKLEAERLSEIDKIDGLKTADIDALTALNTALSTELTGADTVYSTMFGHEIDAKVIELKKEQDEKINTVFKYNNLVAEKEERYNRSIVETEMSMQLKFMEISANFFTKDQLVEMGYYNDVMDCICAYYDILPANTAYYDIIDETKLMLYLDDYYPSIVYMYKTRAGL